MKLLFENWREYLNEEDNSYYKEVFLPADQKTFPEGITYSEYQRVMKPLLEDSDDKFSRWLYNHHSAELAYCEAGEEKGREPLAREHIEIAYKLNPFDNQNTIDMYNGNWEAAGCNETPT